MGTWGTGLYDCDAAEDLRDGVGDLVRLPLGADELVRTVIADHPEAGDKADENHTDFWLALADLMHRYGIDHKPTRESALAIIADGSDLAMKSMLGMAGADLARRRRMLAELGKRWDTPVAKARAGKVLKAPEALIFEPGDAIAYPTTAGRAINPYFARPEGDPVGWAPDGWGSALVLMRAPFRMACVVCDRAPCFTWRRGADARIGALLGDRDGTFGSRPRRATDDRDCERSAKRRARP